MRSPSDALPESVTALFRCSKNSFAVGETLARLSSASAKFGSSEMALSKCAMESVMRSFSCKSRPARYSLRASSEAVVTAILPLFAGAFADVALLDSTCWHPARIKAPSSRSKGANGLGLWFRMDGLNSFNKRSKLNGRGDKQSKRNQGADAITRAKRRLKDD